MLLGKSQIIIWSDRLGLQRIAAGSPERRLTTLLYHHFFFGGEPRRQGRDRLKRQCEWLCEHYTPIGAPAAFEFLTGRGAPGHPLLVTIDDAKLEVLEVLDIFEAFKIPLTLFVCVGWTDLASPIDERTALARAIAKLHFYSGPEQTLRHNGLSLAIAPDGNERPIDALLNAARSDPQLSFADLAEALDETSPDDVRRICNWSEISDLASRGVEIGSHSVSHVRLAQQSDARLAYEILASKAHLTERLGACSQFAYPYGEPDSFDGRSAELLRTAGYLSGYITKPQFASAKSNLLELPRIVLPEKAMSLPEFKARVRGGGIPLTALKQLIA